MKSMDFHLPCACHRPAAPCPPQRTAGAFLMQRILAEGKIHRRCQCYSLSVTPFPCQGAPPFTLVDAAVCGQPCWQEIPCHERSALLLQVSVPLALQLHDEKGCLFTASSAIEEQVRLHRTASEAESWRGQIFLQAAVRLCGCAQVGRADSFDARLEVMLSGYLLSACSVSAPCRPPCPPPKPWYPEAHFDPWRDR